MLIAELLLELRDESEIVTLAVTLTSFGSLLTGNSGVPVILAEEVLSSFLSSGNMLVETAEDALDEDSVKFARVKPFCLADWLVVSALAPLLFNFRSFSFGAGGGARLMLAALLLLLLLPVVVALSLPSFLLMAMVLMLTLFEVALELLFVTADAVKLFWLLCLSYFSFLLALVLMPSCFLL